MTQEQAGEGTYTVLAVASSAGGIHGLRALLRGLPADLPVPVLIVQHLDPKHRTLLHEVLSRSTDLPVKLAVAGERPVPGTVYLAPPDRHLLVGDGGEGGGGGELVLSDADPVHFLRPAADLLFESVAERYGPHALVCVLTGSGSDGAKGVTAVSAKGGTVIVQDPATSEFKGMPEAARATGAAGFVLPLEEIAATVRGLVEAKRTP